ncbi:hypothetical protein N0V90_008864 [Kalmusia sp. IMI 367209]|nr:hypothetical protein N0V90_008864 [Kalmusia sp. IMI 367209]
MGFFKTFLLILVTIFIPPIGVLAVAGCGVDLLINILLTCLGYLPGHIHAFYIEYIFFERKGEAKQGIYNPRPAPGIYSERVARGGKNVLPPPAVQPAAVQPTVPPGQAYGTV